jgi:hypothetical protein
MTTISRTSQNVILCIGSAFFGVCTLVVAGLNISAIATNPGAPPLDNIRNGYSAVANVGCAVALGALALQTLKEIVSSAPVPPPKTEEDPLKSPVIRV